MNNEYFDDYLKYEKSGVKAKARESLDAFIKSFGTYAEKEAWTREHLPELELNHPGRIRHELFDRIVFPVLLQGYRDRDIGLMVWLVRLSQNLYQHEKSWAMINYKTDLQIIRECYHLDPCNSEVRELYLEIEIRGILYSIHEWPSGILIGNNGASAEECRELLEGIPLLRFMDWDKKYGDIISDYEDKLREYIGRWEE